MPDGDDWIVDTDKLSCVNAGKPDVAPDSWTMLEGVIAEPEEEFSSKYPNCVPHSDIDLEGIDDNTQALLDWMMFIEKSEQPVVYMHGEWQDDGSVRYFGTDASEELPLRVDRYGNLCLNMYDDPDVTRIFLAYNDGIFEPEGAAITADTDPETYPENVKNVLSFMTEQNFKDWTAYSKNKDGSNCEGNVDDCDPFSTAFDFLTAIARTPRFCDGQFGGVYSRMRNEAMCAKELSGLFALVSYFTNKWDEDLVDADGNSVPYLLQALYKITEGDCATDEQKASDHCQELGGNTADVHAFYRDRITDIDDKDYTPRGGGYIYGADMYYWFSQIVYGDNTVVDDPGMVETDPVAWWLTIMMRWMIPFEGVPAPHNILLGQWEPTETEADMGITDGFGAVSQLWFGDDQCGLAGHPEAKARTEMYQWLIDNIEGFDGTWKATDTIMDWEANDCAGAAKAAFPTDGDYSDMVQFMTGKVMATSWEEGASEEELVSDTCYIVEEMTDYIVWQKDAFRNCIYDKFIEGL